jgi:hypothetical protein
LYGVGAGASSSSGSANGSLVNDSSLSAKYTGGPSGGQGATAALFVPGGLVFFVTGATGADAASVGNQQGSDGSTSLTAADAQSTVTTTPLVYQPGSDDGPGVVLGVWTGDEGGVQFVPVSDMEDAYDDGAPEADPQGDSGPLWLPGVNGYTGQAGPGAQGWGDVDPGFRVSDAEAAKRLTGLAKMIHDHGAPVSSRYADSKGRVVVYTFADGSRYLEPVEPPSEQYIDSAAAMIPGGIALKSGKGGLVATRAVVAEAFEDAVANRAGQAASAASGGYLSWVPAPILSILLGAKPKAKPGVVDDAAEAAKDASTTAAKGADDVADPIGGATSSSMPAPRSLTDIQARDWYNDRVKEIDAVEKRMREQGVSLQKIYEMTTDLRNKLKLKTRELMQNEALANSLPPPKSAEEILKKYDGDYEKAIEAAKRTNPDVNRVIEGRRAAGEE